ncbi:MAG: hypothetical protein E4H03_10480, partial [Myxococcales bacterium]
MKRIACGRASTGVSPMRLSEPVADRTTRASVRAAVRAALIVTLMILSIVGSPDSSRLDAYAGDGASGPACAGDLDCPLGSTCLSPDCVDDVDNDGLPDSTDPCAFDARNLCFGTVAVDGSARQPIRVNAGGSGGSGGSGAEPCAGLKIDCNGRAWVADFAQDR